MKRKALVTIILLGTVVSIIYFKNINDDYGFVGSYIDGEYASNIPSKDDGYVVEKVVCDNEAVGEWNYDDWGLLVKNMTKKSKCNVYFKKGIRLADTITLVDTTGKCPSVNDDGSVNVTSAESENSLLCSAPDNYGTSYYYRGNVTNNYVKFANFYWRIVRINGDGSIRMIYDGTSAHTNGEASEDRIIGTSVYNEEYKDNAYVGYMYGTPNSSTYEETHANINDSTIKKYIDIWYENNIKNTKFEQYLADNIFCNDRSVSKSIPDGYNNGGIRNDNTAYRWYYGPWDNNYNNSVKILCHEKNDAFTVNDTVKGNGSLKYNVSLISTDEAVLAGGWNSLNENYFLYTGHWSWTLSPIYFYNWNSGIHGIGVGGSTNNFGLVFNENAVRVVLNLKPNSLKSGDGTISNAYRVS